MKNHDDNRTPPSHDGSERLRPSESRLANAGFPLTRWSIVVSAQKEDEAAASAALAELCRMYWYPLYAYARRSGQSPQDAEDLTQEFFSRLLERNFLAEAQNEKGRLRYFLLTLMKRFLSNEWRRSQAKKRGGGTVHLDIDRDWAEDRLYDEPAETTTPEDIFEKQWALTLLDNVVKAIEAEYAERGKEKLFHALKDALAWNEDHTPYARVAKEFDIAESTVKVNVHRMRQRYRELLQREIERTVAAPDEIQEELGHLFSVLRS